MRHWLLLAAVLLVPSAAAEPVLDNPETWDTVLYVHPGGFGEGVLSPEAVPDDVRMPQERRPATECQDGLLTGTWLVDPASGVAAYEMTGLGWDAGMYGNAPLANLTIGAGTLELDWYVQLDGLPAGLQGAVLEATLFEGTSIDLGMPGMTPPMPYVAAATQPADLSPALSGHPDVTVHDADGTTVYGFHLTFPLAQDLTIGHMRSDLPGPGHAFHLQAVLQGDDAACRSGVATGREILLHSSPDLRPQMRYTQIAPRWIEAFAPFAADSAFGVSAAVGHPFGSGGLWIPASPSMEVEGPAGPDVQMYTTFGSHGRPMDTAGDRWPIDHSHGHPGTVMQSWSLEGMPSGTYTVTWTVQDGHRQADATASAVFEVGPEGDVLACTREDGATACRSLSGDARNEAPGPWALAPLLLAFAWAARAARRR